LIAATAAPVPAPQKNPAGHGACVELVDAAAQMKPALHGLLVFVALPSARQKPAAHASAALGAAAVPCGQKKPGVQGYVVPDVCPARQ
jgi:hypothetical protein